MKRSAPLHGFAVATTLATLILVCIGGVVTSKEAGMTVPDWPTSYGYNMFLFPISRWVGGIFYEHTHRLVASGVGFLTIILAVWLAIRESRKWLKVLGWVALGLVILQGVLGGLRVVLVNNSIGIFHACLAQAFFVLLGAISLFTSRWWMETSLASEKAVLPKELVKLILGTTVLIYVQLAIGATMRHQHAGLSITDFPLAYGHVWPKVDPASLAAINQQREAAGLLPTTAVQIHLQMMHRLMAYLIAGLVVTVAVKVWRLKDAPRLVRFVATSWVLLVAAQIFLGAMTIWSNKAADIATLHVANGALLLQTGAMLSLICFRLRFLSGEPACCCCCGSKASESVTPVV